MSMWDTISSEPSDPGLSWPEAFRTLGITPLEHPDLELALAWVRAGGAAAVDIGRDPCLWPELLARCAKTRSPLLGIRVPDRVSLSPETLPASTPFVVIDATADIEAWAARFRLIVQVTSVDEARHALTAGARALISKGRESGGRVGEESSFILLQRVLALASVPRIPVWCQGGMGLHSAAAAIAGGAFGVVLDAQLGLLRDCRLPQKTKELLRTLDGSETTVIEGYHVHAGPARAAAAAPPGDSSERLALGQDAALALPLATRHSNAESLLHGLRTSIAGHLHQAKALQSLMPGSPLARAHGTRHPLVQGPMTRVSDSAAFAAAVAQQGALPCLALALMSADECRALIEETRTLLGERAFGVGLLGFADADILEPQLALIREYRPAAVVLAGGRPAQARALQAVGIAAYVHAPSPTLLGLFLQEGLRHFILEGRECGGHIGPRYSFALWEQQLHVLLGSEAIEELHVLFAGGIHDARSAAMVATLAAPLAAQGAKIGILMGTAYIATREAVMSGAIGEAFQQLALECNETVVLESAPGHAIRALPSPCIDAFTAEKQRLEAAGFAPQAVWRALDAFTLGRLRIATKGIERVAGCHVAVDPERQIEQGLYMMGQAVALHEEVMSIAELHRSVTREATQLLTDLALPTLPRVPAAEPIAIIGMECVFPGADNLETYWDNILGCKDAITEVPPQRWNASAYYGEGPAARGNVPSKWGGFIAPIVFDPLRFGIPPQSLPAIEPAQLLSLEVARRALADAGYGDGLREFDRDMTAVIVGAEAGMDLANQYAFRNLFKQYAGELPAALDAALPPLTEDSFPGVLANVIAGRIANRFGLGGVNYAVDAACASSLTAVELAVKELRAGSSNLALAVGADFHNGINDYLMFASVGALSPRGRCRSFDHSADGTALGEGVGVVVLKRLEDALRDGDRVYAVIDGIAGSSDGKGLGLTAPRKEGQQRALERAYRQAGVLPAQIALIEAHGTGTVVGDATELSTLTEVFVAGGALPTQTQLGSVKSQIGHTKCAAGIAGLIKIAKALHHRVLPPTALIESPNRRYRAATSPFTLNRSPRPWLRTELPARAAISALGFGGTNFHAVLSALDAVPASGRTHWDAELFVFRGADAGIAARTLTRLAHYLRTSDDTLALRDLSYTAERAGSGPVQCAFVAKHRDELLQKAQAAARAEARDDIFYRQADSVGRVAFLYPGQGSQYPNMLLDLFIAFPQLRSLLEMDTACAEALFPPTAYEELTALRQRTALSDTRCAQPALGMVELAANELLRQLGIAPDMVAGHSYGELVALSAAGVFDARTLLQLSRRRGEIILEAGRDTAGKMAAVNASRSQLQSLLADFPTIVLANHNSHRQTVIAGPAQTIDAAVAHLRSQRVSAKTLDTACAFHSPLIARAEAMLHAELASITCAAPAIPVYSNAEEGIYPAEPARIRRLLATHVVSPVQFATQLERMYAAGARVFVEVGPRAVLSSFVKDTLGDQPHRTIAIDAGAIDSNAPTGLTGLLSAVAQLAVIGADFDATPLYAGRGVHALDLDSPPTLPATVWLVDGGRAWPRTGTAPAPAGRGVTQPLTPLTSPTPSHTALTTTQAAVVSYLENMRGVVRAQRDVLLALLGGPAPDPAPTAAPPAVVTTVAPPPATPTPTPVVSSADLQAVLLQVASDCTGYPVASLELDLDLEADLSIDSIKRIEIVGTLKSRLALTQHGPSSDALFERLARLKTLRAMLEVLLQAPTAQEGLTRAEPQSQPCTAPSPDDVREPHEPRRTQIEASDARLTRLLPRSIEIPPAVIGSHTLVDKHFLLTADDLGIATALAARLQCRGATTQLLDFGATAPLPQLPKSIEGLIHLAPLSSQHRVRDVKRFFSLVREALLQGTRSVLVASGLGGNLGGNSSDGPFDVGRGAGLAGMIKSIDREWPEVRAHCVDLDLGESPEQLATYLEAELLATNPQVDVGYRIGRRLRRELMPRALPANDASQLDLGPDSVVLFTGGARGITSKLAIELATRFRCHIELIGRTPASSEAEAAVTPTARDLPALRKLLSTSRTELSIAQVERRGAEILAVREVQATLAAIRQAGASVSYSQLDACDVEGFSRHIRALYARHGRIDGVIHGAGIIEDKLLREKSNDSFARVFDTKVKSALILSELLRDDVKFVVFFSSIASVFGSRGQSDYAAANDVLDKLAASLQARIAGRVLSINFGPWAETGMVSAHLARDFARRGIGLIAVREGVEALLRELARSHERSSQVVLMQGHPESLQAAALRLQPP